MLKRLIAGRGRHWQVAFLLIVLCAAVSLLLQRFVLPTRVALVNYPGFVAARISAGAEGQWVGIQQLALDELEQAGNADLIIIFGRGISLSEPRQALLRGYSQRGTAVYIDSPTDANTDVTSLTGEALDWVTQYLNAGGDSNYRNLMAYARRTLDGKRLMAPEPDPPAPIPRDVLFARNSDAVYLSVAAFEQALQQEGVLLDQRPRLALVTSVPGPFNANRDHINAMIDAFAERGFVVYPLAAAGQRLALLQAIRPDAVVYMPHGALTLDQREEAIAWLEAENIPLFTPLSVFSRHEQWLNDPQGFSGSLLTMNLVLSEIDGGTVPYATVALFDDDLGNELFQPIPGRLERFVSRVEKQLQLREKPDQEKKLAVFFLKGPGQGAMSAGGLEVAPSLHAMLLELRAAGYDLGDLPDDPNQFAQMIQAQAPVLAPYARGELQRWLDSAAPAWFDNAAYQRSCNELLGEVMCERVDQLYGPAPGDYLVANDRSAVAVARLQFGNVVVLPQPLPGLGENAFQLIHGADVAPPHPYLAAYLWVRQQFAADAVIHFGTHGSLEFTPGKQVALSSNDWADALIGDLPHFYVYTMNNVGEAIIAKRRSYATILSHLTPPFAAAGLSDELNQLRRLLDTARRVSGATLTETLRSLRETAAGLGLIEALALPTDREWGLSEQLALENFVERQADARITLGLYTLGAGYTSDAQRETLMQMMTGTLAEALVNLDQQRGIDVTAARSSVETFNREYRQPAESAVNALLDGADPASVLTRFIAGSEQAQAAEMAERLQRGSSADLIRGFMAMADRPASAEEIATVEFDRRDLIDALAPVLADPARRSVVESWRSAQQLNKALDTLDPAIRAKAEQIARLIPAMREALALTATPEMQRLLQLLQNPAARASFTELLDDPDLQQRVAAEKQRYLRQLLEDARSPERLAALEQLAGGIGVVAAASNEQLGQWQQTAQFFQRADDLTEALQRFGPVAEQPQLVAAMAQASEWQGWLEAEARRRESSDRSYLDALQRVTGLIETLPLRQRALQESAEREFAQLRRALAGGFIAPSPGGDPVVAPAALPTGRNMVSIDAELTPSEAAWQVGGQLAEALMSSYQQQHGEYPVKVAMTLWPGDFIQSEGAMIAQILHLVGAEPVRDPFGRVTDVRLLPEQQLRFPRVDVVVQTAGQLRDLAASRLALINKAIRLAAAEGENAVARSAVAVERRLLDSGVSPLAARNLATERVFGGVNGNYGTGIMGMVERSDRWEAVEAVGQQYLVNMNARYGSSDGWGENTPGLLAAVLVDTQAVIQPRESNTTGPLSLDHVYEFMGGLSRAVETVTGNEVMAFFNDFRTPGAASVTRFEAAIAEELHATLLNPKYISGLTAGGASSAAVFAETFRNAFGWEVMRGSALNDAAWDSLYAVYVEDREQLGLRDFFETVHPQSLQEMTAVMLETARKNYWQASPEQLQALAAMHAELIATHGAGCSDFVCANEKLQDYIAARLAPALAADYRASLATALEVPGQAEGMLLTERNREAGPDRPQSGEKSREVTQVPAVAPSPAQEWWPLVLGILLLGLTLLLGWRWQARR